MSVNSEAVPLSSDPISFESGLPRVLLSYAKSRVALATPLIDTVPTAPASTAPIIFNTPRLENGPPGP